MSDLPARLRERLADVGYTYDGVAEVLGARANEALLRNETTPSLRRTGGGSPVETLIRLFLLQTEVTAAEAHRALAGLVAELTAHGVLATSGDGVRARLDCRPYATDDDDLWVLSDLTPGLDGGPARVAPDHVLGISAASTSLAQLTIREPVRRALDLGTGCGVQALHLARHSAQVVATDVNERALGLARFNVALNGLEARVEVRAGSFFEPVAGEAFDLVATNPPFVISPATGERLVYRDSGLPGDSVVEHIVREAPRHLDEGGWCQVLANWVVSADRPWEERLGEWLSTGCDALVVQREVLDPAAYVELWLKDAGLHGAPDYLRRYDAWLAWFEEQGVAGIGFGWVNLRRVSTSSTTGTDSSTTGTDSSTTGTDSSTSGTLSSTTGRHVLLDWPYDVEQPIAEAIGEWGEAVRGEVTPASRLVARPDLVQETVGAVGATEPATIVVRQQRGLRRARGVDTVLAGLVGACDGDLTVGQLLRAIAALLELDAEETEATYLPQVQELVATGFLLPAEG